MPTRCGHLIPHYASPANRVTMHYVSFERMRCESLAPDPVPDE